MFLINRIHKQYIIWNAGAVTLSVLWLDYGLDNRIIEIRFPGEFEILFSALYSAFAGVRQTSMKQLPDRGHPRG